MCAAAVRFYPARPPLRMGAPKSERQQHSNGNGNGNGDGKRFAFAVIPANAGIHLDLFVGTRQRTEQARRYQSGTERIADYVVYHAPLDPVS